MLSFLPRRDYCWKSEFDTAVKIENYYHHDGEWLGFNKKSTYQNRAKSFKLQETKDSNLLYLRKNALNRTSNATFNMKIIDLGESWLNR